MNQFIMQKMSSLTEKELLSQPIILISSVPENHGLVFEQIENLFDYMLL